MGASLGINYFSIIDSRALLEVDYTSIMSQINTAPSLYSWDDYIDY